MIDLTISRIFSKPILLHVRDSNDEPWKMREVQKIANESNFPFHDISGTWWGMAKNIGDVEPIPRFNGKPLLNFRETRPKKSILKKVDFDEADVVLPHVIKDLKTRAETGLKEYGKPLHVNNGRDALQDVYEELLDGACYIKQKMLEEKQKREAGFVAGTLDVLGNVRKWSTEKGLDKRENAPFQFLKVSEEVGELAGSMARDDYEGIVDGIGDVAITLIILAQQLGLNFEKCLSVAWDEIKDRKGKTENGVFIKDGEK